MPLAALLLLLLAFATPGFSRVVVFWQAGFPTVESQPIPRGVIEKALDGMSPDFRGIDDLASLEGAQSLVLPYGSAVPADAWPAIRAYIDGGGNLVTLGGRALWIPVYKDGAGFRQGSPQNGYSKRLGITHTYEAPQSDREQFAWGEEFALFAKAGVRARRVFVASGSVRGLGFYLDARGRKASAPIVRADSKGRAVLLNFEPEAGYWESASASALIRQAVQHASAGPTQFWVEVKHTVVTGDEAAEVTPHCKAGAVELELLIGDRVVEKKSGPCETPVTFSPQASPGLRVVRSSHSSGERHFAGFYLRDLALLRSGPKLEVSGDYFKSAGKPFLPFGANYFSSDPNRASFFTSGRKGGNAYYWDRDFAEMAAHNVTFIRTGTWMSQADYLDETGAKVSERFLRSLEAFLMAASANDIHVQFTFFAFDPQTIKRGSGNSVEKAWPGANPYTDPVAVEAEKVWVRTIAARFRDVPNLSWDLINEPSCCNPKRLFKSNTPNGDATEIAAWNAWLEKRYGSLAALAETWNTTGADLGVFGKIALPEEFSASRAGGVAPVRALDYNLFVQDVFKQWVAGMIAAIRSTGSKQMVVVGQDEGGVTDRVLNQFFADAGVDFTVNHTWWKDDALLWDSVVAKRPDKPNLIGETGVQPSIKIDATARWDEVTALGLEERKLALGFAAANAGTLHWQWTAGDGPFGVKRPDGSLRSWQYLIERFGAFARQASPYVGKATPPDIAIVLPQSLQLSAHKSLALEAQDKCVRALFHHARLDAYVAGEYQLNLLGSPKLIIVPSPWILRQDAWDALLARARKGAVLLVTGRFDADEHFHATGRANAVGLDYAPALLTAREHRFPWPAGDARVSFGGDRTTILESGALANGDAFREIAVGEGKILYSTLPLELGDNLKLLGEVYRYAAKAAGVRLAYETDLADPGILIAPTRLPAATMYVLTSESGSKASVAFRDVASGQKASVELMPGAASVVLVRHDGQIAARYDRMQ